MASKSGTFVVRVVSDTKPAEQGLDRFGGKVAKTGDKLQSAGKKMSLFASVPIAAVMTASTKAASDLNETLSKSNTVFGKSAKAVEDWADGAAESFGQSKREALDAASTFGNLFVQLGVNAERAGDMSMAMTELASDFASFHNADITEVINAQSAAFRGEYDALQRFVPTINAAAVEQKALADTGKATTKELTAQEKALAVQTLMLEGAGDAMGDFDRTSDSAANQTRIATAAMEDASAEIGQALLPLLAEAAGGVADLAKGFGDLPKPVQNGILALAGIVAVTGPILTVAGNVGRLNNALRDTDGNLTRTGRSAATFGKVVGALAIAGLAYETIQWANSLNDARVDLEKIKDVIGQDPKSRLAEFIEFLGNQADGTFGDKGRRRAEDWFRTIARESPAAAESILKTGESNAKLRDELNRVGVEFAELDKILKSEIGSQVRANEATERSGEIIRKAAGKTRDLTDETEDLAEQEDKAAPKTEKLSKAMSVQEQRAKQLEAAIDKVNKATETLIGVHLSAESAGLRVTEQFATLAETLKENGHTLDINTEKGRANREALVSTTEAALAHVQALKDEGASVDEVNFFLVQHVEHLKKTMRQAGLSKTEIASYIETLGLTPENIETLVELNGVEEARRQLADLTRVRVAQIDAQVTGSRTAGLQLGSGGVNDPTKRHSGGRAKAGTVYTIGRPGAEELFVSGTGGDVISGPQTDRILGQIAKAPQSGATSMPTTQIIRLEVDGRVLAEVVNDHNLREGRNRGEL